MRTGVFDWTCHECGKLWKVTTDPATWPWRGDVLPCSDCRRRTWAALTPEEQDLYSGYEGFKKWLDRLYEAA